MRIRPLFKQFGSKWSSTKAGIYPAPKHRAITEQFCGAAGYSLNFSDRKVFLYDADPMILKLWSWLISEATEEQIRAIPLNLPEGLDVRTIGLTEGQALLLKHWQRTNNCGNCWTISPWGNKPGQWTENTRARVAEEFEAVRHWTVLAQPVGFFPDATHFVDPPYVGNYAYKLPQIDHVRLGKECQSGAGQIIVCEGLGKDGSEPEWLPFAPAASRVTSRRKSSQSHHRMEYIWTNEHSKPRA
jgi:hypothetical protein